LAGASSLPCEASAVDAEGLDEQPDGGAVGAGAKEGGRHEAH